MDTPPEFINNLYDQLDKVEKLERIIKILKNSYDGVYSEDDISGVMTRHTWADLSTKIKEFDELLP